MFYVFADTDTRHSSSISIGSMGLSMLLNAAFALVLSQSVESFVIAPIKTLQCKNLPSKSKFASSSHMTPRGLITRASTTAIMMAGFGSKSKPKEKPPTPGAGKGQSAYLRQVRSFEGLRGAGADGVDVYVSKMDEKDDKFIFVGKVAWSSGVTVEQALQWQRDLIVDHAKKLEPSWESKGPAPMRIFTAPINSEVEVARNIHDLVWVLGGKSKTGVKTDGLNSAEMGLKPEIYEKEEAYFYVRRLDDGRPSAPPAEVMMESMENLTAAGVVPGKGTTVAANAAVPPPAKE